MFTEKFYSLLGSLVLLMVMKWFDTYKRQKEITERTVGSFFEIPESWIPRKYEDLDSFFDLLIQIFWLDVETILWTQPILNGLLLSPQDVEQMLGVVCHVKSCQKKQDKDGNEFIVCEGSVRRVYFGVGFVWSCLNEKTKETDAIKRLKKYDLIAKGPHFINIECEYPVNKWKDYCKSLLKQLGTLFGDLIIGVYIESVRSTNQFEYHERILSLLKICDDLGFGQKACCCIRAGSVSALKDVEWLSKLSEEFSFEFDFTAGHSLDMGRTLQKSYYGSTPYYRQKFDFRAPLFRVGSFRMISVPVQKNTILDELPFSFLNNCNSKLQQLISKRSFELKDRLLIALSPVERATYLERLQTCDDLVTEWMKYHVYNWQRTMPNQTHMFVFDPISFCKYYKTMRSIKKFADLKENIYMGSGYELLSKFVVSANSLLKQDMSEILKVQHDEHLYLSDGGREQISGDSAAFLEKIPDNIGDTLELGCGYGVLTRIIKKRANTYVGFDLEFGQSQSMNEYNVCGVNGDMHHLPFLENSFDTILADNVLEHSYDPLLMLSELKRVLRPSGSLFALMPLDALGSDYNLPAHFWKADEESILHAACSSGFCIDVLSVINYRDVGVYGCFPASLGKTAVIFLKHSDD